MKCQKTIDARSYSHQTLEEIRISAVRRVEAGESPEAVVAGLGMNRRTIYRWLAAYPHGGEAGLQAKVVDSDRWGEPTFDWLGGRMLRCTRRSVFGR